MTAFLAFFSYFANLPWEFRYSQTGDPRIVWFFLKDVHMCGLHPLSITEGPVKWVCYLKSAHIKNGTADFSVITVITVITVIYCFFIFHNTA